MKSNVTTQHKPKRILWIVLGILGLTAVACLGIGTLLVKRAFDNSPLALDPIEKNVARYQALGLPWTADDLVPDPPTADENAYPIIINAFEPIDPKTLSQARETVRVALQQQDIQVAKSALDTYDPAFQILLEASQKPRLYSNRDRDKFTLDKNLAAIKSILILLSDRALLNQELGNDYQALADLKTCYTLGTLLTQEPGIMGVVGVSIQSTAYRTAEKIAAIRVSNGQSVSTIRDLLAEMPPVSNYKNVLNGEMYYWVAFARNATGGISEQATYDFETIESPLRTGIPKDPGAQKSLNLILNYMSIVQEKINEANGDYLVASKSLDGSEWFPFLTDPDTSQIFEALGGISFEPDFISTSQAFPIKHTLALAYLESLQYKLDHGDFPDSIDQLPSTHTDPLGNPLQLTTFKGNFTVYSFGLDQNDDQGMTQSELEEAGTASTDIPDGDLRSP